MSILSRFEGVEKVDLRAELSFESNIKLIANFSALADHKDYFTFINTAELVCNQRNDVRFLIFGKGELETELKDYVKSKKLSDQILFTGFRDNLPALYPNIDVLLFTSKTEGLGTTILDAFASNVPVVATNAGGIPEMVIHKETGLLSEIGDAENLATNVNLVLDDTALRQRLTENAKIKCQDFSKDRMVELTEMTYKNVLNN